MRAFFFKLSSVATLAIVTLFSSVAILAQAQASAADLTGTVTDQNGAVIAGATVTAKSSATNISRSVTTNDNGEYSIIALPPGSYEISTEASGFKKSVIAAVTLTIGQSAELTIKLEVGTQDVVVNVDAGSVQLIETSTSNVASTIDSQKIESLPINERSATGFALTLSTVGRDNGRPIGPAPTSGLNIGGQRGRSTQVNVDGADFTDNSTNSSRSTVSQEAVQEYQVATNSYTAEFGRATGGVINVVTKRGTNTWNGNVFGYLRDKSIQARNAFAPVDKPDYRRTQYGFTLGGPISKDRTFFFFAFERRQRDESGFFTSNVAQGLTGSVTIGAPILPFSQTFDRITPAQATYANTLLTTGNSLITQGTALGGASGAALITQGQGLLNGAVQYLYLASSGGKTALTGTNTLLSPGGTVPITAGTAIGSRFFLSGAPVPVSANAFRPLNDLLRVFPITDRSNFSSIRGDHNIDDNNQLTLRFGYNTSNLTGIQVESQNQSLGQNDFSRTGITVLKDASFSMGLNSTLGGSMANEFKFTFGKRKTSFKSQNGEAVAYNISGTAFIGRELFSPVDRQENRFQLADNITWVKGDHTFKFGADFNWIEIPEARFELNFAGLFNFGQFAATNLAAFPTVGGVAPPDFTPVQSYGLGLPSIFIQGFGDPISRINNKPMAFFAQDSWKMFKNFTVNYGIRYDFELTKLIPTTPFRDPLSGINLSAADVEAAQDAMGVRQGFPRDKNNFAPRLGFAWDIFGNQKTKLSGSIGLYYDHPLLAVGFNSDVADAAQQQQSVLTPGSPAPTSLFNATQVFQGTIISCNFAGAIPGVNCTPGLASSAQYQAGRQRFNDQTFTGFGAVLPFTLPVAKDFQYASATQANLTIERQLTNNMALSASYIFVGAHHLPRPTDLNSPNTALQIQNFNRLTGRNPVSTTEAIAFSIPSTAAGGLGACPVAVPAGVTCFTLATPSGAPAYPNAGQVFAALVPGMVAAPLTNLGNRVVAPAIANFFRPSAPNYFLAQALSGGAVTKTVLDGALTGSLRTPGVISPFGSVNAQLSDGNSSYNAMKLELNRRYANNFTFLASYTWSHSIDDSSDLQTLLISQDVKRFDLEKADSLFDQRHRFVFSGAMNSPVSWRSGNGFQKFLADFTIAPIIEVSSGRPFNIITNVDTNNDQSTQTDRPNVDANGVLTLPPPFSTGVLGRNMGLTHMFFSVDLGITRAIRFGDRARLDLIAQGFNLFNRFNEGSASPLFTDVNAFGQRASNGRYFSRPTAAFDPRQFQFGAKLSF
jgi:Carboxypeptidase regulatory-like domain